MGDSWRSGQRWHHCKAGSWFCISCHLSTHFTTRARPVYDPTCVGHRDGETTKSNQLDDRLSTGALVEELELKGERLCYKLVSGTGPAVGWAVASWVPWPHGLTACALCREVSIKLKDKDLAVKTDKAPATSPPPTAVGPKGEAGRSRERTRGEREGKNRETYILRSS